MDRVEMGDFKSLAKLLFDLLADLEQKGALKPRPDQGPAHWKEKFKAKLNNNKVARWTKEKLGDAKETVQAAKIITKLGMKTPKAFIKDPEKTIIDFLNDILVLFLIIWMDAMRHISRYNETLIQCFMVGIHFTAPKHFIEPLHRLIHEGRISSLGTIRPDFLVVKEACHTHPRASLRLS